MEYVSVADALVTLQGNVLPTCPRTQRNAFSIIMPTLRPKIHLTSPLHSFWPMIRLFSRLVKVTRHTLQSKMALMSSLLARMFPKSSQLSMVMSAMIISILILFMVLLFRGCRASGGVLEFESRPPDHVIFICYRLDLYASPHLFNNTRPRILKDGGYEMASCEANGLSSCDVVGNSEL